MSKIKGLICIIKQDGLLKNSWWFYDEIYKVNDKYDYLIVAFSGVASGMIDVFSLVHLEKVYIIITKTKSSSEVLLLTTGFSLSENIALFHTVIL